MRMGGMMRTQYADADGTGCEAPLRRPDDGRAAAPRARARARGELACELAGVRLALGARSEASELRARAFLLPARGNRRRGGPRTHVGRRRSRRDLCARR